VPSSSSHVRRSAVLLAAAAAAAVVALTGVTGCGSSGSGNGTAAAAVTTSLDPAAAAQQDAVFATAMIEHHHQTLQLVGLAAVHAENPAILSYAGELQTLHDTQMGELSDMMTGWGKTPPHIEGHTDLGDSIPGLLDKAQLASLTASPPAAFEKTFLATLIAHQTKALPIARQEIELGGDGQAKAYAQKIVDDVNGHLEALEVLSRPG
jgi:uncharacterized protein (DUF305 family)